MVSLSGIRGIVGRSLTGETVRRFAGAFAARLPAGARVVLARDTRPSGEAFAAAAAAALQQAGCAVFDLGPCATPAAKMMVLQLAADGAVIVTASHNPAEWNGLKLIRGDGVFLDAGAPARWRRPTTGATSAAPRGGAWSGSGATRWRSASSNGS